jgi:hypothetical protein
MLSNECGGEEREYMQGLYMKTFMKTSVVAALALAMVTFGTPNARAWGGGWPIAAGVFGGLAVGTVIGATVASASAPAYAYPAYSYPVYPAYPAYQTYQMYPAPAYNTATPAVQPVRQAAAQTVVQTVTPPPVYVQQPAPVYYYSSPVVYAAPYPYVYPCVRFGWGHPHHFVYRRW